MQENITWVSITFSYEFKRLHTGSKSALNLQQDFFLGHSSELSVTCREVQEQPWNFFRKLKCNQLKFGFNKRLLALSHKFQALLHHFLLFFLVVCVCTFSSLIVQSETDETECKGKHSILQRSPDDEINKTETKTNTESMFSSVYAFSYSRSCL